MHFNKVVCNLLAITLSVHGLSNSVHESSSPRTRIPKASSRLALGLHNNKVLLEKVDNYFKVVSINGKNPNDSTTRTTTTVLEAPVRQDNVKLFIAIDGKSFASQRPGNGGIRLLKYKNDEQAIQDAIRLAEGMTRKHNQFRTGFSGAKLVVNSNIDLAKVKRKELMEDTAEALKIFDGSLYTGCDLNTCDVDMDYLTEASNDQYVLAGRNSRVDTNVATASSVVGSITGLCEAHGKDIQELTFTVQGCGKVGTTVAKELVRLGAKRVQTCDICPEKANIAGCNPIQDWTTRPCDVLVPCANSLAITEKIAVNFPQGICLCTGATNSPFSSSKAKKIFADRGISFVPESISSAGAILADSVEWYDKDLYQSVEPNLLYDWVRSLSHDKAHAMAKAAKLDARQMDSALRAVTPNQSGDPVGKSFPKWIEKEDDNDDDEDGSVTKVDTLIIGGGCAGTATAFSLSERGRTSLLLERGATLAPPSASSNGDSRMYRQMYSDPFFSLMQKQALGRWANVEEIAGESLLQKNGLLFYGEDTGETVEGSVSGAKQTMQDLGIKHTFYKQGDDIANAYPALAGCRDMPYSGVYEDTAGHIRASKACAAMVKAAGDLCQVKTNSEVVALDIVSTNENDRHNFKRIVAKTQDNMTVHANNLVICAGPWTNQILEMAQLPKLNIKIWQIQWAHYRVDPKVAASIPQAFFFRKPISQEDGGLYYVFPASATESLHHEEEDGGSTFVKVGVDFPTGEELHSMDTFDYQGSEKVLQLMDEWVQEHLPGVGERIDSYTSPYTMTEDSYFVMDKVCPGVSLFSGGSGRAFKFGPLLGDCLASLVTGDDAPVPLDRFSVHRAVLQQAPCNGKK